ncbi:MAG: nickel-dependent hydrogenase large subunit [Chromatiaceae bacterium]|nr:nickel-dependent hydrogenase large subunit [Chromatiaceae bacterium]
MNDLSGRLQIHLLRRPEGLAVDIASSRLVGASRVFIGKSPMETAATLPSLFSVCATAQAVACVSACEVALGQTPSDTLSRTRGLLVEVETAREHLWRLLLDWPGFLGEGPRGPAMARVMGACGQLRSALAAGGDPLVLGTPSFQPDLAGAAVALTVLADVAMGQVLGQAPRGWLAANTTAAELGHWAATTDTPAARLLRLVASQGWSAVGRSTVPALPALSSAALEARLGGPEAEDFIARPLWAGAPAESSPFTRQLNQALVADLTRKQGNGLLTRLTAQLVELAVILAGLPARLAALEAGGDSPGDREEGEGGVGLAQVQAARGLLVHRIAIQAGRVVDYRILAPTEWNFHPQGAAALGLATLPDADDETLRRIAGLFVTALDPCVAYDVRLD